MSINLACPVCKSSEISVFFDISDIPTHIGILWPTQDVARNCLKGDVKLAFCQACTFITNIAFDPTILQYTQAYDNSLHYSATFGEYAHSLASRLIERYDIHNKKIIEIGCGQGDFLRLLCQLGDNRGVGFDPSYQRQHHDSEIAQRITFIRDYYSERYATYKGDLICCRQVLEHIHKPIDFLTMLRDTIGRRFNTILYFEVPNVSFILHDLSIWDIIYEHCSYFSSKSLVHLFKSGGFDVLDLIETYQHQFLGIEASPAKRKDPSGLDHEIKGLDTQVNAFDNNYRAKIELWRSKLQRLHKAGQRAVVWGAGARGVSFLNMLKMQQGIEYVVDINPKKQGNYIAGTGQKIVPPEFLRYYHPDLVIVMNPIYKSEIQQMIKEIGITTETLEA